MELANHPYIHFWHRLDTALLEQEIPGMGSEVLAVDEWRALFEPGILAENPYITMYLWTSSASGFDMLGSDQVGSRASTRSPTTEAARPGIKTRL